MKGAAVAQLLGTMTNFRRNVAAILQNRNGEILVAERADVSGAWQFPQGGVDEGESDEEALVREVEEELGVKRERYSIGKSRAGYRYRFPNGRIKHGKYHGQEQVYFLCAFEGDESDFKLDAHHREFVRVRWIKPQEFSMRWVPDFKREVYRAVLRDFFDVPSGPEP